MFTKSETVTQSQVIYLVSQYLLGQNWQLIDPVEIGNRVWQLLGGMELATETAVSITTTLHAIHTTTWQQYALYLHNACRQANNSSQYQQAWTELNSWLQKQAPQIASHLQEQQDMVQEALLELQDSLQQQGLRVPYTLWAYALQVLRRKHIDLHRKRMAKKRGEDQILSLEEAVADNDDRGTSWEETLTTTQDQKHHTEHVMAQQETRTQLQAFFRRHLPTELQQQVAEAHFLDDLTPQEIAALMGKRPHEIRLIKARIVHTLRELPPLIHQELMAILDKGEEEGHHEA